MRSGAVVWREITTAEPGKGAFARNGEESSTERPQGEGDSEGHPEEPTVSHMVRETLCVCERERSECVCVCERESEECLCVCEEREREECVYIYDDLQSGTAE